MEEAAKLLIPVNEGKSVPNNFDLIRIAMAVLVVWSHSFALCFGSEDAEPFSLLTAGALNSAVVAVQVFFIVSGFLIAQSYDRSSSAASFMRKRVLRIYPGYLVATSICAFLILPIYTDVDVSVVDGLKTLGQNLVLRFDNPAPFTQNPTAHINGSLWSIPYEFWCYIGVLLAGTLGLLRRGRLALFALVVMVTGVRLWLDATGRRPGGGLIELVFGWQYTWFFMLPGFGCGMLAYLYRDTLRRHLWIAIAGPLLAVAVCHLPLPLPLTRSLGYAVFQPALAYTVLYFAFSRQLVNVARFGDFSYGTYLYAYPIQQILLAEFPGTLTFPSFVALSMLLSVGAGVLSWHGIERWFSAARRTQPRAPVASAEALS